jgi:hypothetical protein
MPYETGLSKENFRIAKKRWPKQINRFCTRILRLVTLTYHFSIAAGDLILLDEGWYVTHAGLLRLARRSRCLGIHAEPAPELSDVSAARWAFKATVYKSQRCRGFVGYGDADPSNVSPLVRGAEMRVAETRAVNRALRKAYGIGICSVDELGSSAGSFESARESKKLPPQPAKWELRGSESPRPPLPDHPPAPARCQFGQGLRH